MYVHTCGATFLSALAAFVHLRFGCRVETPSAVIVYRRIA